MLSYVDMSPTNVPATSVAVTLSFSVAPSSRGPWKALAEDLRSLDVERTEIDVSGMLYPAERKLRRL
jgi:hypothetical protein